MDLLVRAVGEVDLRSYSYGKEETIAQGHLARRSRT